MKAHRGEVMIFTGIDGDYEPLPVRLNAINQSVEQCIESILLALENTKTM